MIRYLNWLAFVVLLGWGVYFLKFEQPFLSYEDMPFELLTPEVHPGEVVRFRVVRCNSTSEERAYSSSRTFVPTEPGKDRVLLDGTTTSALPGCTPSISTLLVVPKGTPPGDYYAAGIAKVDSTFGPDKQVPWRTQVFRVLP